MLLKNKPIIGMIHVPALPGTPNNSLSMESICDVCLQEAKIYIDAGINALMIENMHDIPYLNTAIGPEITAAMAVIGREIKKYAYSKPVGIQILAAANKEALAAANAAGLDFIRAEGFV
ncbi:MAG: BtpA family membrane complex biogenesis protein, partial [bacterium]|nr:BtpA family membrane complex biogenesis protein [bacterium]